MRVPHFLLFTLGLIFMVAFFGCSRESSVKENVNLKNNHSRVFIFKERIEDLKTFKDSITAITEMDTLPDTLTVTINDSVYMIGVLPYYEDKIYGFEWILTKKDGKDTSIIGNNEKQQVWAYAKPGLYEPKFVAHDGNDATDTAGTATRKAWVRVIDTKPKLVVPKDTLWTKHDGDITFPILASDSFGIITSIKVDLDASGKGEAKSWKYETFENNDSLYLTIKNKDAKIDSLGNQKIYVIVTDDDNNETKDSVNLHFNRIPKLKIIYPQDGARHNIKDRFYFYYEAEDADNPQNLKYFIYAQVSHNGQPPKKAFTEEDLIAEEFTSNIFEPIDQNGKNVIATIKEPNKQMTGRIYWDMYATDGYDVVHMKRISTGEGTSRPWSFYIGDLSSTQGTFTGVAKYQGRTKHGGIQVIFSNGNKTFDAQTDEKGNYTVKLDAGTYTITAHSDSSKEYSSVTLEESIESGSVARLNDILLKDTVAPMLLIKNIDTLTSRELSQSVYARDLGAFVDTVTAAVNGTPKTLHCTKSDGDAVFNCPLSLNNLKDGEYTFVYEAKDKAGNVTPSLKQTIIVRATSLALDVNGAQNDKIGEGEKLVFTAKVIGAYPDAEKVNWTWNNGKKDTSTVTDVKEGVATYTIPYDKLKDVLLSDSAYLMTASYKQNGADVSASVQFGILGVNPAVVFKEPGLETTVTVNDPIHFITKAYKGQKSVSLNLTWDCGSNLSAGYTCPTARTVTAGEETEADLAFSKVGTYKISATITDGTNKGSSFVTVHVVNDPPTINVVNENNSNEYKINSIVTVKASASDKFGTINQIKWGCSNGNIAFDNDTTFATPQKSVSDIPLKIILPGTEVTNHRCVFKAIDDDNEEGFDTLTFTTLLDKPTVSVSPKRDTVKINSNQTIKANAVDKLGYIAKYEVACSDKLSELKNPSWDEMPSSQATIRMPSTATNYYCVVQVTDDDGNTAKDTATYKVLLGLPTVTASVNYTTVTIKDVVELNAHAQDSLGNIVKYEWGCGSASTQNIGYTYSSTTTPRTTMQMPATPQKDYKCIIRVTDDDGNTDTSSVTINIILAPPTVKVKDSLLTVREGFNITLDADASDNNGLPSDPGSIVKREWNCGTPSQIENKDNWKTVSDFDTVWKAPAPQATFYCVARVTDNDGNIDTSITIIKFSTETPLIDVKDSVIHINIGDEFELDASINDVWQGIDWFTWECKDSITGETFEKKVTKYDYNKNGKSFMVGKDSSYSMHEKSMYCTISAQEHSTKAVFSATTLVSIIKQHPIGIISAADTVYLWSGDESVDDEALYFYTSDWNGKQSKIGELGNKNKQDYWWKFSNVDNNFYQGNPDGSMDTSIAQFNAAFIRSTYEGSMTIYLDYRDSTTTSPSKAFYSRHRAEEVSHKVYFRRAWQNQGKDTVITSTSENIVPAMVIVNDNPTIVYLKDPQTFAAAYFDGSNWNSLGSVTAAQNITQIYANAHDGNLYIGILDNAQNLNIYRSNGGTSPISISLGTFAKTLAAKIVSKESESYPHVVRIASDTQKMSLHDYNGTGWSENANFNKGFDDTEKYREVEAIYSDDGKLIVMGINASYTAYYRYYKTNYELFKRNGFSAKDVSQPKLVCHGKKIYMAFLSRDVNTYGPRMGQGTIDDNNKKEITWVKQNNNFASSPISEGIIAYHLSLAINKKGTIYAAVDDNGKASYSQVHVYRYENNSWHLHGENQLPYFNKVFYETNNYYLRGWGPMLDIDDSDKVYVSMLARENAGGAGNNNGPLVMKFVADNWEIK